MMSNILGCVRAKASRPVVLKPRIKQTASMIFLHGLGDSGHSWAGVLNTIRPDHMKVICPTAPVIPITINMGFRMPAWFDIINLDNLEEDTDIEGVKASAEIVNKLIEAEIKAGIPSQQIIIGGFSQGAALAVYTTLHYPLPLGGCIALSTFIPKAQVPKTDQLTNTDVPFFQAHGETDPLLPLEVGLKTDKLLKSILTNHEFRTYNVPHDCSDKELADVKEFIEKIVGH